MSKIEIFLGKGSIKAEYKLQIVVKQSEGGRMPPLRQFLSFPNSVLRCFSLFFS
jgi:hypothetical protein